MFAPELSLLRLRTGRKWSRDSDDVLPAWIADMDFQPAGVIRDALLAAVACGDLGYGPTGERSGVPEAFAIWAARRWGWKVDPGDVMVMPDIATGVSNCIEALTAPGDAVVVQVPAYPPLMDAVQQAGRRLITSPIDAQSAGVEALAEAVLRERATLLILCNPHNPTGRVFLEHELRELANLTATANLTVISDEVHADLTLDGRRHIPFASLGRETSRRTVTLNSPSKAFNIAGLRTAVCVAETRLRTPLTALGSDRWTAFSTMGLRAARAAWSEAGEEWLAACIVHLERMRSVVEARLPSIPGVTWRPPQASYLAWFDCRALNLKETPATFFFREARVALAPGEEFGLGGEGFVRLNFATSAEILREVLDRMAAVNERRICP
jgi:cystathionine beta-lyase